jgi:holo-ACP synthase/triphosphoribosyl-dephospho-CoA synthase
MFAEYKKDKSNIINEAALADRIANCSCRALLYEVSTTPKPGLVDRDNSGAHKDMDFFTFVDSTAALIPYFRDAAICGMTNRSEAPENVFQRIRHLGIIAEESMFQATKGINTHKGLIFSLGVICGSAGWLYGNGYEVSPESVCRVSTEMLKDIVHDFDGITEDNAVTYGEVLYAKYGIKGIRGEAGTGFPSVINYGLPALKQKLKEGKSLNDAGVYTLLTLMAHVTDTNVITRSNKKRQEELSLEIKELIERKQEITLEEVVMLDRQLTNENISPGGSADLLALTFFFYFMEQEL